MKELINIQNCRICNNSKVLFPRIDWQFQDKEAYLVTGSVASGKDIFIKALAHALSGKNSNTGPEIIPNEPFSIFSSVFTDSVAMVSLEDAARLIEEERERDESEILNKEDAGRTGRQYICEVLGGDSKKNAPLPPIASRLEALPQVKLCAVAHILDRGLRYMSTGEIRRTLLCRALLSGKKLLILSEPFAGLDAESKKILLEFFNTIAKRQLNATTVSGDNIPMPKILLCTDRFIDIPDTINRVLEVTDKKISYCGERAEYEVLLQKKEAKEKALREEKKEAFLAELKKIKEDSSAITDAINSKEVPDELIRFENVNVGWGEHKVLIDLSWTVKKGEHYLIKGPNGSGKTTLLELITGDNMQVFRENVYLFGKKRGTGETLWDIRKQLGIVSYRLHVEYRMVGGTSLTNVLISGFHDSIGLYEEASDYEKAVAEQWLKLAGFNGRGDESFSSLSYGEQRAILILRAAVKSPRVLILDEPCHGLDEEYRQKILDLLETVAETGTTTLLHVTHDESEVLPCEKNVLILIPQSSPMYRVERMEH